MAITVGSVSIDVVPDLTRFNAEMEKVGRNLAVKVQVDLNMGDTLLRLQELRTRLDEIGARRPSIQVDADTAAAAARLAALQAQLDRINGQTANANVNISGADGASGANGGIMSLTQAAVALSPALVTVAASAAGAGAALISLGAAGAAGAGVLVIALSGVTKAVGLLGQQQTAQKAASASAASSAASNAQAIVSAQRQIQSAQMSLADAQRSAASQQVQDSRAVASAQTALTQATQQVTTAQKALTEAQETGRRELESYANGAADAALAQQQAAIDLQTTQASYSATMASSTATDLQKRQAALDLQKAQQSLVEANQKAAESAQDNTAAQAAGVQGTSAVVSAQKQVADAQSNQQQAVQSLADAQRKAAEDQITSQESIVRAQQGVAAAMDAMAAAERQSTGQTNASLAAINAQVAALDPATRAFAEYLRGTWTPIWKGVQSAAAGGLLPGVQSMLESLQPLMPAVTALVGDLAQRMGDLAKAAGEAFQDKFWQTFFSFISQTAGPALTALGQILGDVIKGFAGLLMAFQPVILPIIDGIGQLAAKFGELGASASSNPAFQRFIDYIIQYGPLVMQTIEDIATVVWHVIEALAPLGPPLLAAIDWLAKLISNIPIPVLTGIAGALIAIFVGLQAFEAVSAVVALGPWVLGFAAFAAVLFTVYANSKTFRDFVADNVIPTLQVWWSWIKDNVVPALQDLWSWIKDKLVPVLAGVFMDAWNGITTAVQIVTWAVGDNKAQLGQVWDVIKGFVGFIVSDVIPIIGTGLKFALDVLGGAIGAVIFAVGLLVDAWNGWWALGKDLGAWFATDFVGFFQTAWDTIRSGWSALVTDIKNIWQDIEHWVMDPVAWVVDHVINGGLINAWDWVSDHILGGHLHVDTMPVPDVPPLAAATGGYIAGPGTGTSDSIPVRLSNGEFVINAASTAMYRPLLEAINGGKGSGGPGFRGGGLIGDIWGGITGAASAVGNLASDVWHGVTTVASVVANPVGFLQGVISDAMGGIGATGPFVDMLGSMVGGVASQAGSALADAILGSGQSGPRGGTGGTTSIPTSAAATASFVQAAAANFGWDSGPEWAALSQVINRESGWNPNAANPTSSARGLFQKMTSIYGPIEPTVAGQANWGLHYIQDRYGDPIGAWAHEQSAGWYDQGGLLNPGLQMVYNGTGAPELVAPQQTFEQIMSGASGGAGKTVIGQQIHGDVYFQDNLEGAKAAYRQAAMAQARFA